MTIVEQSSLELFDADNYIAINAARWRIVEKVVAAFDKIGKPIHSAYDLGCGPGWFSNRLAKLEIDVVGLEGRASVVEAAKDRCPEANFRTFDIDANGFESLPPARDFCLSLGILYHLENPIRAIRITRALTKTAALIETMTYPAQSAIGRLVSENRNATQGLRDLAFILSPSAIAQILASADFKFTYMFSGDVDHQDFVSTPDRERRRHIFLASDEEIVIDGFDRLDVPEFKREDYWKK